MSQDDHLKQRLSYIHKKQKNDRSQQRKPTTSKAKPKTKFSLPSTEPYWNLKGCDRQTFENPLHALNCVMKELKFV